MPFDAPFALQTLDLPRPLRPLTVHQLPAVEVEGLPRLYSNEEARKFCRTGVNKWTIVKREIDCIMIQGRQYYTAEQLLAYLKRRTRKAAPPAPREKPPPKAAKPAASPNSAPAPILRGKVTPLRRHKRGERERANA
jgi:hypothetical protein